VLGVNVCYTLWGVQCQSQNSDRHWNTSKSGKCVLTCCSCRQWKRHGLQSGER
jgi:hypothetical protein